MYLATVEGKRPTEGSVHRLHTQNEYSDQKITEFLAQYDIGPKDGYAIIPAKFRSCTCAKCEYPGAAPGFKSHRLADNVVEMSGFAIDLDHLSEKQAQQVIVALRVKQFQFWHWNTHSHSPPDDCRLRILLPFEKPYPLSSAAEWSEYAWPKLMEYFGLSTTADRNCKDPSRLYFTPRRLAESAATKFISGVVAGKKLSWDGIIEVRASREPIKIEVRPAPVATGPVDMKALRERLGRIKHGEKATLVKKMLAGEPLTPPPSKRGEGQLTRYSAWLTLTSAISMPLDDFPVTLEAILELLRESWLAEQNEAQGTDAPGTPWDVVSKLMASALDSAPATRARKEAEQAQVKAAFEEQLERAVPADPPAPPAPSSGSGGSGEGFDWKKLLKYTEPTKNRPARLIECGNNIGILLTYQPQWLGKLRYNVVTNEIEVSGGILPESDKPRTTRNSDATWIQNWLSRDEGVGIHKIARSVVEDQMLLAAERRSYDPLKTYLEGLKWDGVSRCETMFERYFGAALKDAEGEDISAYVRAVSKRWCIAAVARALRPGCQMDNVLILQGMQGIGKTRAVEVLGGEWFSGAKIDPHDKDSLMAVAQAWISELGELGIFQRNGTDSLKEFFTKKTDQFRRPYGRVLEKRPRRCVFIGTTDKDEIFNDTAGERRYWPVTCGQVDIEGLKEARDQIWAEAVVLFKSGEQWHLTPEENVLRIAQTDARAIHDNYEEAIRNWILAKPVKQRPKTLQVTDSGLLLALKELPNKGSERRIGDALRKLGFLKRRERLGEDRVYLWYTPSKLLEGEQNRSPGEIDRLAKERQMSVVAGGTPLAHA